MPFSKVVGRTKVELFRDGQPYNVYREILSCGHELVIDPHCITSPFAAKRLCRQCDSEWVAQSLPPGPPPKNAYRDRTMTLEERVEFLENLVEQLLEKHSPESVRSLVPARKKAI